MSFVAYVLLLQRHGGMIASNSDSPLCSENIKHEALSGLEVNCK